MVISTGLKPFVTRELVNIVTSLEGVIYQPDLLPEELRTAEHWLKVERNERGEWKKPFSYWNGKRNNYLWTLASAQRELDKVLNQEPPGKAGLHARGRVFVIDLDDVIDPVTLELKEPKVLELIEYLKTPVYLSSSGNGSHLVCLLADGFEITDVPVNKLSYRMTDGKSGEFLGGNYSSFVAFTGVALPQYERPLIATIGQEEWDWLRNFLWSEEARQQHRGSSEPETQAKPAPEPQTRALREPEANNPPFDIVWKTNYIQHVRNMLRGFNDRREDSDETPSGLVYDWVLVYWKAAKKPTWDGAVKLSIRAEGYVRKRQPGTSNKKPKKWHEGNVNKALKQLVNNGELVYRRKGDKEGETPASDQQLQALKYAQSEKMKPSTQKVFLQIVAAAKGRDRYRLTNQEIAEAVNLDRTTVISAKKELANNDFLEIKGNVYKIRGI